MVAIAGAAIEANCRVVVLDLEIEPVQAERPGLVVDQLEQPAPEPPVPHRRHQVDLVEEAVASTGFDAEADRDHGVADHHAATGHHPTPHPGIPCHDRLQGSRLADGVEDVAVLGVVGADHAFERAEVGRTGEAEPEIDRLVLLDPIPASGPRGHCCRLSPA